MTTLLFLLTCALSAFLLAASALAITFPRHPILGMPQHWGLQLWWLALLGALPALWLREWVAFAICAAVVAYWTRRLFRKKPGEDVEAAPLLRIVFANLLHENTDYARGVAAIAAIAADVVVLCETTPGARAAFRALEARLPHALDTCVPEGLYGITILSRFPLRERSRGFGEEAPPRHLAADLDVAGMPVSLVAIHPTNPLRLSRAYRVPGEFAAVAAMCRAAENDLIVIGDCNAAGWSHPLRALEQAAGITNDRGLRPSWPVWLPHPIRLPLDHVWVRGRLTLRRARLGRPFGSDHLPLIAEIGRL
ncbi:MAG TPA: endonuclease/exonuclease/phosphatase family protein [Dongiaceae bacterium]|nr:endonuclease/exonuclease/phosphatase family protein [Dongiaceae bacterium]